jgi:hypothetical protein
MRGWGEATGVGRDVGVTPDQDLAILSLFNFDHSVRRYRAGGSIPDLHAHRYLQGEDVIPFLVLLSLMNGLKPDSLKAIVLKPSGWSSASNGATLRSRAAHGQPRLQ